MINRRRNSLEVTIGSLRIGAGHPICVQSMTNTPTEDVMSTLAQIRKLADIGCEIVRLAVISPSEIEALKILRTSLRQDRLDVPLVADVHFSPSLASAVIPFVDKLRINPGNFAQLQEDNMPEESEKNIRKTFVPLLRVLKKEGKSLRLGVNHGSLSKYILKQYGHTVEGMLASVVDYLKIAREEHFDALVLSFKANHVPTMVRSYREADKMLVDGGFPAYPFHLGVTEAGNATYGRIKGAIGIGSLLLDGLGDTLRVSLTEDPCEEISVAYDILQAAGVRTSRTEYVACPTCGRTHFNLGKVFEEIKTATRSLKGIKIAVMGCGVNGFGEMADADYACVGSGKGKVDLYDHGRCIERDVLETEAVTRFLQVIKETRCGGIEGRFSPGG